MSLFDGWSDAQLRHLCALYSFAGDEGMPASECDDEDGSWFAHLCREIVRREMHFRNWYGHDEIASVVVT